MHKHAHNDIRNGINILVLKTPVGDKILDRRLLADTLAKVLLVTGRVLAFDIDAEAVAVGRRLAATDSRFEIMHRPFADLAEVPFFCL